MICVGIDVAKDKHDCFILSSEGITLADVFTIPNNLDGFNTLLDKLWACSTSQDSIKVGLEATGHYSYNILGFLLDNGLATYVMNPLRTNLYRKSLSLRKTKTDRVDARTIAAMLMSCTTAQFDTGLKPYTDTAYHNEELKSLTRYRFDKVRERQTKNFSFQAGVHPVSRIRETGIHDSLNLCLFSAGGISWNPADRRRTPDEAEGPVG